MVRSWGVLQILTWTCASRHNGVHVFDLSTSNSGPKLVCFVHFHLEMCFAPQRRPLFRPLNFQKWSEAEVFCKFWFGNVIRATMAYTVSTSQLPKVLRSWSVLYILTWTCASRHNGVHVFDLSTSNSGPKLVCCVHFALGNVLRATTACTFSTSQLPTVVRDRQFLTLLTWKCASRHNGVQFFIWPDSSAPAALASLLFDHRESRLSYLFAHLDLLSSHSFSSLLFSLLGFSSLTLPISAFPSVHIVGTLTSKLPSITYVSFIFDYHVILYGERMNKADLHRSASLIPTG